MTQVTITNGFYRNEDFAETVELVQGYTEWQGERRRVGTAGPGYLKVRKEGQTFKVTVPGDGVGYATVTEQAEVDEAAMLRQEVEDLRAQVEAATGRERQNLRKRLARREAKLAKV